jgi:flavin reductase (DIM6/NTAB) family NADH-FMN oxidoreductase RutF
MAMLELPKRPIGPFPTVLVGAEVNGRPNYACVGACGVISLEPVLYVSMKSTHHTTAGIRESGFFSVNYPSGDMVSVVDYCGLVSGVTTDKGQLFTAFYDPRGRAPLIKECPLAILCRVVECIPRYGFELFLGEIVAVYGRDDCLTAGVFDPLKMSPIILAGAGYYALGEKLGQVFSSGKSIGKTALATLPLGGEENG